MTEQKESKIRESVVFLEPDEEDGECSGSECEIQFPLPEHVDPSICRDEFIKLILNEEEKRISSIKRRSTMVKRRSMSVMQEQTNWGPGGDTPETMALISIFLRYQLKHAFRRKSSCSRTLSIMQRQTLMQDLNQQCQKAAIEFMSVRLLRQLRLFSSPWPGKLDEIPYRLFSWSLDHFMTRLSLNQMYLDVINRERSADELDCLKFRTDLNEIMLLIYEIREDFRDDRNFCENSIQHLRDAKYNLNGHWIQGVTENRKLKDRLKANIMLDTSSSINLKNTRLTAVLDQIEDVSALDPIELRYRFNWLDSCAEQRLMRLNGREEELAKQLKDLEITVNQDDLVRSHSEQMYCLEVDSLRQQINSWQSRFDNDLENAEVECTVSRLALQKVKDDHKFYTEQEEMYKRRIAEERELMAKEEKIRRDKQAKAERTTLDVATAVKELEAVHKPKEPAKKKKKPSKF